MSAVYFREHSCVDAGDRMDSTEPRCIGTAVGWSAHEGRLVVAWTGIAPVGDPLLPASPTLCTPETVWYSADPGLASHRDALGIASRALEPVSHRVEFTCHTLEPADVGW